MAWIIDKDFIADPNAKPGTNANAVGVMGPHWYSGDGAELSCRFRIRDDDGVLYYEGRSSDYDFRPLEDFGMPNAGATRIEYFSRSEWREL